MSMGPPAETTSRHNTLHDDPFEFGEDQPTNR
jgi:hypothetical protein